MAEWIRQWTSDLMRALRAGLIPGTGDFFYDDEASAKRNRRRAGMSAANVSTSLINFFVLKCTLYDYTSFKMFVLFFTDVNFTIN